MFLSVYRLWQCTEYAIQCPTIWRTWSYRVQCKLFLNLFSFQKMFYSFLYIQLQLLEFVKLQFFLLGCHFLQYNISQRPKSFCVACFCWGEGSICLSSGCDQYWLKSASFIAYHRENITEWMDCCREHASQFHCSENGKI